MERPQNSSKMEWAWKTGCSEHKSCNTSETGRDSAKVRLLFTSSCTLCIDQHLQGHRAVSLRQRGFLVKIHLRFLRGSADLQLYDSELWAEMN